MTALKFDFASACMDKTACLFSLHKGNFGAA
jgi:hypothetical protein